MTSNLSEMHYLESLVSDGYKKSPSRLHSLGVDSFFLHDLPQIDLDVIEQRNHNLDRKIEIIKNIQKHAADMSFSASLDEKAKNQDEIAEKLKLKEAAATFFLPFVDHGWELARIISTMLGEQKKAWKNKDLTEDEIECNIQRIADMMIIASILEIVAFPDRKTHNDSQRVLDQFLFDKSGYDSHLEFGDKQPKPSYWTSGFRADCQYYNILVRLIILRLKRVFDKLAIIIQSCKNYVDGLAAVENGGLNFFLAHLSWLFFLPRLVINIVTTIRSFFNWGLTEIDRTFGWKKRLQIQLEVLWAELANDIMWFTNGICSCFVLAGCIPVIGVYFLIATQLYDFVVNCYRSHEDMVRIKKMKARFQELKKIPQMGESIADIDSFLDSLEARIKFDRMMLFYILSNFALLLLCIVFMMPAFATISPIIPMVASIVALLVSVYHFRNVVYAREKRAELYGGTLIPSSSIGFITINVPLNTESIKNIRTAGHSRILVRQLPIGDDPGKIFLVEKINGKHSFKLMESQNKEYSDNEVLLSEYDKIVETNHLTRSKTLETSVFVSLTTKLGLDLSEPKNDQGIFDRQDSTLVRINSKSV